MSFPQCNASAIGRAADRTECGGSEPRTTAPDLTLGCTGDFSSLVKYLYVWIRFKFGYTCKLTLIHTLLSPLHAKESPLLFSMISNNLYRCGSQLMCYGYGRNLGGGWYRPICLGLVSVHIKNILWRHDFKRYCIRIRQLKLISLLSPQPHKINSVGVAGVSDAIKGVAGIKQ